MSKKHKCEVCGNQRAINAYYPDGVSVSGFSYGRSICTFCVKKGWTFNRVGKVVRAGYSAKWMTIKQAAEYKGVSRHTMERYTRKKNRRKFPSLKKEKGRWRFLVDELDEWQPRIAKDQ